MTLRIALLSGLLSCLNSAATAEVRIPFQPGVEPEVAVQTSFEEDVHAGQAPAGEYTLRVQIKAPRQARLAGQMDGHLATLNAAVGDRFNKGDLLVRFDCTHQRAGLDAARAKLSKAEKSFVSQQSLARLEAVSPLEVALAKADVKLAEAQVAQAKAAVEDCRIAAPYDGRIVAVMANQYENVSAGTPLLEIVESGRLRLEGLMPSQWLRWLKEGAAFDVHIDELGTDIEAVLTRLGAKVDPVSQTLLIRGQFDEDKTGLLPGMSGTAHFGGPDGSK